MRRAEVIGQDLRQAVRALLRTPGLTLTVLLLLTLGIGLNTALFTLVDGALLRPLPYKNEDRLFFVWETHPERGRVAVAPGNLAGWRSASSTVESAAASFPWKMELAKGEPEPIDALLASDGYFSMLGVTALLGRTFDANDYAPVHALSKWWGSGDAVVISEGFWKRHFGSDPSAIGQVLRLDGKAFTVVGVMPAAFQAFWVDTDVWLPWVLSREEWQDHESHELPVVARLRAGATREAAEAEISGLYARMESELGASAQGWRVDLVPLRAMIVGDTGRTLLLLLGGAALVLLVTCTSVASLLLARAVRRERETAVRCSLGASPIALLRQPLLESAVLSGIGAALGAAVSILALRLVPTSSILPGFAFVAHPQPDLRVLCFVSALAVVTAAVSGIAPALRAWRLDPLKALKQTGPSLAAGRLRSLLVCAQVALAYGLLVAGGTLAKSFIRVHGMDLGFEPERRLTLSVSLPEARYPTEADQRRFHRRMLEDMSGVPGVEAIATTTYLPLMAPQFNAVLSVSGRPASRDRFSAACFSVSPNFFGALRVPVSTGRAFNEEDRDGAPWVTVISARMAREYWGTESPLGNQIRLAYPGLDEHPITIVGVASDVKQGSITDEPVRSFYLPFDQRPSADFSFVVRTSSDPSALAPAIRSRLREIDKDLAFGQVQTMEHLAQASMAVPRLRAELAVLYAGLSFLLASVGLYGLLAFVVASQTRETGIRMALGARPGQIMGRVVTRSMALVAPGLVAGLFLALGLGRLVSSWLYGVAYTDPPTYLGVGALLVIVALGAGWRSGRRASSLDPWSALRHE